MLDNAKGIKRLFITTFSVCFFAEDPVALNQPLVPNSLLKLLKDMFAERSTAGLLYTTDTLVLIDIVARELYDLPSDSGVGDDTYTWSGVKSPQFKQ